MAGMCHTHTRLQIQLGTLASSELSCSVLCVPVSSVKLLLHTESSSCVCSLASVWLRVCPSADLPGSTGGPLKLSQDAHGSLGPQLRDELRVHAE